MRLVLQSSRRPAVFKTARVWQDRLFNRAASELYDNSNATFSVVNLLWFFLKPLFLMGKASKNGGQLELYIPVEVNKSRPRHTTMRRDAEP